MGSHEFQTGVFIQPVMRLSTEANYLNGGFILEEVRLRVPGNASSGYIPFHRQFVDPSRLVFTTEKRNSENYAVYVQDSWKPVPRLTLVGGIRFDRVVDDDELFDVRTQSSLEIGPRAGAIYALTADSRNIVHGSFSRLPAKPEWIYLPSLGGSVTVTTTDTYDTLGDGALRRVGDARPDPSGANRASIRPASVVHDEICSATGASCPARSAWTRPSFGVPQGHAGPDRRQRHLHGGVFRGYDDVSQNAVLLQTNNVVNTPIYTGVEVIGSQRTRRSQFPPRLHARVQHSTDVAAERPSVVHPTHGLCQQSRYRTIRSNESNSLSGTAQARNPMWIKHALRLAGSLTGPWGLTLSSSLNIFSGPYTGPIVKYLSAPDPQFGPATLVLSNGRTVSNPLATTVRFAHPSRGEGQLQAPTLAQWNARVGRRFGLATRPFEIALSLLNITNRDALQSSLAAGPPIREAIICGSPNFA